MSEEEKEKNKELEATLKQTQDSWFKDTQELEQEKEKNIKAGELLAKRIKTYNDEITRLDKELIQEKEKNKKLEQDNLILAMENENSISKDKIKELIEEIYSYGYDSAEQRERQDYAILKLKELLGE